jgi:hypothetical protein
VPNAACREAFRRSGAYPFQQWNEITGFPQDYSQASVEQAIKDCTLCSGGDLRKAGLDVRSTQWHKTPIKPQSGKIRVMFYATLQALRALRQEAGAAEDDPHLLARIDALLELLTLLGGWMHGMQRLDDEAMRRALRHGAAPEPP